MDVMEMAYHTALSAVLRRLIEDRRSEIKERLASGVAIDTIHEYREIVGTLKGLADAIDLLEEAEKKLEER